MGVLPAAGTPNLWQHGWNASGGNVGSRTGGSLHSFAIVDNVALAIPLGTGLSTLALLTFLGNAMVVHAIRTERKLHTVSNMFILSLALADMTVGLVVMPLSSTYVLFGDWILGLFVCQLWLVIDYTASTASIFNLLILSLDRYWSIRSPLKYLAQRTKKRALAMIGVVWMISALWAIPIIGWHQWYNGGVRKHPNHVCETEFSDSVAFKITTSIANFITPMSLMVILYYKIFREIKRRGNISDICRSINRVSCAQHRGGNKENSFTASFRQTADGSFHTSSISNGSKRKLFLKQSKHFESASVSLDPNQGDIHGCSIKLNSFVPRHKLLRRLLSPFMRSGTNRVESDLPLKDSTLSANTGCTWLAKNEANGSVRNNTLSAMTNDLCHSTSATTLGPVPQQILISSPSPVRSCDNEQVAQQQQPTPVQLAPYLREMRREQLSRDNGHRIMRMSVHCPNCTDNLVNQIVSDHNSGKSTSSQTTSYHCDHSCVVQVPSYKHCSVGNQSSLLQSPNSSPSSSLISSSVSLNSTSIRPLTPAAATSCPSPSSSLTSSNSSPNSSSVHLPQNPSPHTSIRNSPPVNSQFVPQSASSDNIHHQNTLQSALTKHQRQSSHDPIIASDQHHLNNVAFYRELTLMTLHNRSISPYISELVCDNKNNNNNNEEQLRKVEPNNNFKPTNENKPINHKDVQSKSSLELSNSSTNNLLSVQGNHYAGVNVQVEYVDPNGQYTNLFPKCRILSKSASNVSKASISCDAIAAINPPTSVHQMSSCDATALIALSHSQSCLPLGSVAQPSSSASPTNLCSVTSACPPATNHDRSPPTTDLCPSPNSACESIHQSFSCATKSNNEPINAINDKSDKSSDRSSRQNTKSSGHKDFENGQSIVTKEGNKLGDESNGCSDDICESTRPATICGTTTNTTTTAIAPSNIVRNGKSLKKKKQKKSSKKKSIKKMKRSPSNISPNSDEIRNESLRLSPEQMDSCHSGKSQCSMCGCSLSKSISQTSNLSNVHVGQGDEQTSIRSTTSVQGVSKSKPNMSLMSVPKHSGQLNSFTNLPMLTVDSKPTLSKQLSSKSYSSFRESFNISKNSFKYFGRPRKDSLAQPANSFCAECASLASAVSAAARHRHELRREESSRLRQEKKAARQLGVILGAFILCWMPYIITYVVTASCTYCVSLTFHQVTIWLGYLNSFLNPFLYALCNENFKHAFKKMLGRMPAPQHLSYNYDQQTIGGNANTNGAIGGNGTVFGLAHARVASFLRLETKPN